ncbi:ADP-glyceromanno-heptose 6-epimerase [Sphingomonas sp. So64.6b]|uniref:ADP-glyceromanno-heptose 6-epimerase n=1 Tax=Sphingomonas sp. So64.6b TaxID=2997354 RepID=UPI0015FF9789|nr:ADP-glyceromanno-heptose 6-epimerase [Sphingomonas sp. So64.6b]QNA82911.1 ADP-glyceromanno-heptose 6-epimerase [Sphingomonas sp. So64.6b]
MILITGGAGFIGANVVAALQGRRPIAVADRFGTDDKWKNLRHAGLDMLIFPEEIESFLAENGNSVSSVIHMGAISATTERDVDLIVRSNIRLSRMLWDFCARRGVPFIYASSAATYGDGNLGFEDRSDDAYLSTLRPLNAYGWSKLAFDHMVSDIVHRGEPAPPRWAGLKFFNVYGPREQHKGPMRSVMTANFEQLRDGASLKLFRSDRPDYADGGQMRDFIYVEDCVAVIAWMLDHDFPSDLYNVGTGHGGTWVEAGEAMFAAVGRQSAIEFIDMPPSLVGRYQYFTQARMEKLAAIGAPVPATSLHDGVAATYAYLAAESE